jgi:SAM-dependent methyltransferase
MSTLPSLAEVQNYLDTNPAGFAEVKHLQADRIAFFDERDRQTQTLYPHLDDEYGFTRAKNKLTLELGSSFLVADAEHLPFAPETFEMIFSSGVIHHSPDTQAAAKEIIRSGTDFGRLQNPLSRVYTKQSACELFNGLSDFHFVTEFHTYRPLDQNPSAFTKMIRKIIDWANTRWGWFLIVHAKKQ